MACLALRRSAGAIAFVVFLLSAPAARAQSTVISLDFDDGLADGLTAAPMLEARGMRGTFFILPAYLGKTGYLTLDQVQQLQASGHEIAGHTVSHPDLTLLPTDEAQREICTGRDLLVDRGLDVRSFAYPYGAFNAAVEAIAQGCGYDSARSIGGLSSSLPAETLPPTDPFAIRTTASVRATDTLDQLEPYVLAAEATGGWYHFVFHHVCDNACDPYSVSAANLGALLDWLAARAPLGTVVRTERDVVGGPLLPEVAGPPPTPRTGRNLVLDPSLEDLDASGAPSCWQRTAWGSNAPSWSVVPGYDGAWAQQVTVSSFGSGGVRLNPSLDLGHCAPPAAPNHTYQISGAYRASASPLWVATYRDALGQWRWWTQSGQLAPASSWVPSTFTTPPLPLGASAVSFGLSLYGNGTLAMDAFSMTDLGPSPPSVALTSPPDGSFVRGTVTLQASASSVVGIDHVEYRVDGVTLGSSSSSPFAVPWNTATGADRSGAQVTAVAYDTTGVSSSATSTVTVANQAGLLLNPSLEVVSSAGVPGCWQRVGWGTLAASWTRTTDAHAGSLAQRVDVTSYSSGGVRLMPTLDGGPCAPPGSPGRTYTVTGWYKSTAQPILVFNYRNASGTWSWFTQSASLPASSTWRQVTFTTPALPAGATALSFGLSLYAVGSLTVDDFALQAN